MGIEKRGERESKRVREREREREATTETNVRSQPKLFAGKNEARNNSVVISWLDKLEGSSAFPECFSTLKFRLQRPSASWQIF